MKHASHCAAVGLAFAPFASNVAAAQDTPVQPTTQQLLEEVRALRGEVKELRSRLNDAQSPATRPAAGEPERRPSFDEALIDLDRRIQSADVTGTTAGWDPQKGFVIRSDDGSFLLHPWAFIQVRDAVNYRENAKFGTSSDTENGLELPRMKLILDGNVLTPDLTYQFIWATSDTTGNLGLQDAWGRYHIPQTPFAFRAGQIRNPLDHEQIVFATKSLTPERSIVNNVLLNGDDIVKGASFIVGADPNWPVRTEIAYTGGERNFNTTFQDYPTNPASWGAAGRVEWKLTGDWADYSQFTSLGHKQTLLVIGGGADYTEAGDTGQFTQVGDVQFNTPAGLMLYGAYLGRYTRHNGGEPGTNGAFNGAGPRFNTYDATVRVMAAYVFDSRFEPFVRYEYLDFDRRELPASARSAVIHDVTAGFNYYFHGHRAKFTFGATYLPNGSPVSNTLGDLLVNSHGNQVIVQGQFQLMI